ncbi:MAG TPA: cation:proton antiporter [Candidatus Angelobacter sp.]|nr:cation:proton antiporter [Candidatus Angelobacter sp.]
MSLATSIMLSSLELTRLFFAMVLLLFTAHSFGFLFYEAKLPRVIGEIFGALILGPTFLGYFAPGAENWVFGAFPSEGALISVISYFGLVLLMFISGFEVQRSSRGKIVGSRFHSS